MNIKLYKYLYEREKMRILHQQRNKQFHKAQYFSFKVIFHITKNLNYVRDPLTCVRLQLCKIFDSFISSYTLPLTPTCKGKLKQNQELDLDMYETNTDLCVLNLVPRHAI